MALDANTMWELQSGATAGMLNGGGFNINNANFVSDFTTDTNTANTSSPVLSSATYNFVAGDVGAWVFVKSGTNSIPGFYKIASVASNKATLSAGIGAAVIANPVTGIYDTASTAAGIATVGTPTGLVCGVDYSQQTTANFTKTDLACTTPSTTITSATGVFTQVSVGNILHITAITGTGTLVGWYEIVSYVSATSVVLDRTPAPTNNASAGTYYVGGALDLTGSLGDSFFESIIGGNTVWIQGNNTFVSGGVISVSSTSSTGTAPSQARGYNALRGDRPTMAQRPIISQGANSFTWGQFQNVFDVNFTGTTSVVTNIGAGAVLRRCRSLNSSTTTARSAITMAADSVCFNCEAVSQNGIGLNAASTNVRFYGCYAHDCANGMTYSTSRGSMSFCVIESCSSAAVQLNSSNDTILLANNTLYGSEAKIGTGIALTSSVAVNNVFLNNIIYGFTTGISQTTTQNKSNMGAFNDFYNNTTDTSLYYKDGSDIAVNPAFANVTQLTGSTATTSGSVLTQSGGDFSTVTDNVDYVYISAGTGITVGKYLITSHTSTTITLNNAPGTNATADKVWSITTGHNFAITGAI